MARSRIVLAAAAALSLPLALVIPMTSATAATMATTPQAAAAAAGAPASDIREQIRKDLTFDGKPVSAAPQYTPRATARQTVSRHR